ncbi:uncharacterized protein KD926_003524 [Aspergillus affinis]|uniref:uncharacterized protein n=1 Tax=Aspergillus affinis TaxID=1070780 RepID=UPI0022FE42D7|nr:Zn(II)2Cys6 transcription factor [Aspergillus affinis]KAI9035402.1 Zn(II)2Cys6 transcription factor [Aspergillus affinis]
MLFGLMLASTSLLRIFKGPAVDGLNIEKAKASFTAIKLSRQMSVDQHDAAAILATITSQLSNSTRAFRRSDNGEYTALRIRSRLAASVVVDVVWWWREDFELQCRQTGSLQGTTSDGATYSCDNFGTLTSAPNGHMEKQNPLHIDDQFIADFEWALGDDGMFSSTAPFDLAWPSSGAV